MKKLGALFLICSLFLAAKASAEEVNMNTNFFSTAPTGKTATKKTSTTDPLMISMIFYKTSGKTPDFRDLAMKSDEYLNTSDRERVYMLDDKIREYQNVYNLINKQEPIVLEVPVTLSKYNDKLKGFFISSFDENWFYSTELFGRKYAIVPEGLIDLQWIKMEDKATADKMSKLNARAKLHVSNMTMIMTLEPLFASVDKPITINKQDYWSMSVRVKEMKLYSSEEDMPLWEYDRNSTDVKNDKLKDLIKTR